MEGLNPALPSAAKRPEQSMPDSMDQAQRQKAPSPEVQLSAAIAAGQLGDVQALIAEGADIHAMHDWALVYCLLNIFTIL